MKIIMLFLLFFGTLCGYSQSITDNLVFLYRMDGNVIDDSGNGYDASNYGAVPANDRFGSSNAALSFNGASRIELPNISALKIQYPITIGMWVNINSLDQFNGAFLYTESTYNVNSGFIFKTAASNDGRISISYGDDQLGGQNSSTRRTKVSDSIITVGNWHHISAVINGPTDMKLYIDCRDAGGSYSGTGTSTVGYDNTAGNIGYSAGNSMNPAFYYSGAMDDVAFWSRALSLSEVTSLCEGILDVPELEGLTNALDNTLIYPNPGSDLITIESISGFTGCEIINMAGDIVQVTSFESTLSKTLVIEEIPPGLYLIRVTDDYGNQVTKRFSKL